MTIDLGKIQFEKSKLFKQLKHDLKDDWFPDPLIYSDVLGSDLIAKCLTDNVARNNGKYVPEKSSIFNIPKSNFTLRYALETSTADRFLYHGLTSKLVPYFDPLLEWNVFSHRYNRTQPTDRYMFTRSVQAWKNFIDTIRSSLNETCFLLSTDLANYFENIQLEPLRNTFINLLPQVNATQEEKEEILAHIEMLFDCLKTWAFQEEKGLPQNRDASSFLANMYMREVDAIMLGKGYQYYRYMDDIKVVCADSFDARRALKDLSIALRNIGLAVNSKKTKITAGSNAEEINELVETGSIEIQQLDAIWRSPSRNAIARSIGTLKSLTLKLIKEDRTDSKDFRFCISRMERLARCEDFHVPDEFFADITPSIIKCLMLYPAASDQFIRYLLVVPLSAGDLAEIVSYLCNPKQSVYSWQNYRNWLLLAEKPFRDDALVKAAEDIVKTNPDSPTRAGASIYLGAVAEKESRVLVAEQFGTLNTFLGQRCALIAVHELPYDPYIKDLIQPNLRHDLHGVFRKLIENKGRYFIPPEKVYLTSSPDMDRQYE